MCYFSRACACRFRDTPMDACICNVFAGFCFFPLDFFRRVCDHDHVIAMSGDGDRTIGRDRASQKQKIRPACGTHGQTLIAHTCRSEVEMPHERLETLKCLRHADT